MFQSYFKMEKRFLALTGECNANKMFSIECSFPVYILYAPVDENSFSINQTLKWKYCIVKGCCGDYFILLNRRCLRKNKCIYFFIF